MHRSTACPGLRRSALALVLAAALPAGLNPAVASCNDPDVAAVARIQFSTAYAQAEVPFDGVEFPPDFLADWLVIRGTISSFGGCLTDLNAPGTEYTFVLSGGTVHDFGLWDDPDTRDGGSVIEYAGASFRVFREPGADADFLDPGSFEDGEEMLRGSITRFLLVFGRDGTFELRLVLDGGSEFSRLKDERGGFAASGAGEFQPLPADLPVALASAGYFARVRGGMDVVIPLPVRPATWSRLKALELSGR